MNRLQPYEHLIAEELEQAQVPDRADAIWAVIEKGLDLDMPTDNGPSQPPSSPKPGAGWGKGLMLLAGGAIVVAVTILLLSKNKNNQSQPARPDDIIPVATKPPDSNQTTIPLTGGNQSPVRSGPIRQGPVMLPDSSYPGVVTMPPVIIDSNTNSFPLIIPSAKPDSIVTVPQSQPPPKGGKQRGVKGIKDSDYKIVTGNKDSI